MSKESPKSSEVRPPPWPTPTPAGAQRVPPLTADPAPGVDWNPCHWPPWWCHWWYDPAPPWLDLLDSSRKAGIVQAQMAFRRSQLEAELTFVGKLIDLLPQNPR
jgi:hypothetical protein